MPVPTPEEKSKAKIEPAIASEEALAPPPLYPTEQYRALGIPHCKECGEKFRTGIYGEAICAIDKDDCPHA